MKILNFNKYLIKKKFRKIEFCICSKSQEKENIEASVWYRNYNDALIITENTKIL